MSIITKIIVNADAEVRYLTPGELDQISTFVSSSDRRLRLVKALTESRDYIIKQAANQLFQSRPHLVSPGGNAYGEEMTATCLRDMDYYLRLVSYSIAAGDVDRPELSGREAILNIHAQKVKLGKDVNLKAIALLIAEAFSSDREF
jgi:hypothetical protein